MKKIFFLFPILLLIGCSVFQKPVKVVEEEVPEGVASRSASYYQLSTILTWFETGDKPTQQQFEDAWSNSYNSVSDGMWDLTGYPSIGFTPYATMEIGKFSSITSAFPDDTTTRLNYDGTLAVSNLWVNGVKFTGSGSDSSWTYASGDLYPNPLTADVAIGATSAAGFNLYVDSLIKATWYVEADTFKVINSLADVAKMYLDGSGNLILKDENTSATMLSDMVNRFDKSGYRIFPSEDNDTLDVGNNAGPSAISLGTKSFNVMGTAWFNDQVTFDEALLFNEDLTLDIDEGSRIRLLYNSNEAGITLSSSGYMQFFDEYNKTPVSLSDLLAGGGSGEVDVTGSPQREYVAYWTNDTTITGSQYFYYDEDTAFRIKTINAATDEAYIDAIISDGGNDRINIVTYNGTKGSGGSALSVYSSSTVDVVDLSTEYVLMSVDSFRNQGYTIFDDSIYVDVLTPVTRWGVPLIDSLNGNVLKCDSVIVGAGYGLNLDVSLQELLNNVVNGEIPWPYEDGTWTHNIEALTPNQRYNALMAMIEVLLNHVNDLEIEIANSKSPPRKKEVLRRIFLWWKYI